MASRVSIVISAQDRASAGFKKVSTSGNKMRGDLGAAGAGITRDFKTFGKSAFASINKVTVGLIAMAVALGGVTIAMKSFVTAGVAGNAQMETFLATLATTEKNTEKAMKTLEEAVKFAAETPFQIPEVVEATVRLKTYGIEAKEVLTTIGDLAAVMGKPLMQAIEAIADAQTGELERLKEFGITKSMLIKAGAQVNSRGAIKDMQSLNKALFSIMEERFAGGMKRMSQTFTGVTSNLKDAWSSLQRVIVKPIFDVVKASLFGLLQTINRLRSEKGFENIVSDIGQSLARVLKLFIALPKVMKLVIRAFVEFVKKLGDWDFASRALIAFLQFFAASFIAAFVVVSKNVVSFSKILWNPLVLASTASVVGIINVFDTLFIAVQAGFKLLINIVVTGLNFLTEQMNKVTAVASKIIPKWDIPPIPTIPSPFEDISKDFDDLTTRVIGRTDILGEVWNDTWKKTTETAKIQISKMKSDMEDGLRVMANTAEGTLIPILEEAIPEEIRKELQKIVDDINAKVIPSVFDWQFEQKKVNKEVKKTTKLSQEFIRHANKILENRKIAIQFEKEFTRVVLGENVVRIRELEKLRRKFLDAGIDRVRVEEFFDAKMREILSSQIAAQEDAQRQLRELTMETAQFRLGEIERVKNKMIQSGIDVFTAESIAASKRVEVNLSANNEIRKSSIETWQSIIDIHRDFIGFARRGFGILRKTSSETWQELIADIIEWGTTLVAQYLFVKGFELLKRTDEAKTHAQFLNNHAAEMTALAGKFLLMGNIAAAAAAGIFAVASKARALQVTAEARKAENLGKTYIAAGIAVQTGGAIAGEALKQWGIRADDARQRQVAMREEAARDADEIARFERDKANERLRVERNLELELIGLNQGREVRQREEARRRVEELKRLGVDPSLIRQFVESKGLSVDISSAPVEASRVVQMVKPELVSAAPSAFPGVNAIETGERGLTLVQNNEFNGLVNFDNPEALRELARKLLPFTEELSETFVAV